MYHCNLERWQSGRMRQSWKLLSVHADQGFKSLPLRHLHYYARMKHNKNTLNTIKIVFSFLSILFFFVVIIHADKFHKWGEPINVSTSFVQIWHDTTPGLDIELISMKDNGEDVWVLQYVVQPGDTLGKIAATFGTTVSHIQKINNIRSGHPIRPNQKLIITNEEKWFLYNVKEKTNIIVFANKYNLNAKDLMTLNYIQDETEILNPGQQLFINIDLEQAYKVGLKKRPIVKKIPKLTKVAYTPTIKKTSAKTNTKTSTSSTNSVTPTRSTHSKIIRQRVFKEPIKNRFYAGHCTWWAAIITPEIFPYTSEHVQVRPFGGNANQWYDNAARAWFSVWKTPRANSLVIYQHGSKRVNAGHVWRVIAYYPKKRQMIVRDMNWKGKFIFTDRWESIDNSNIKGYIYIPSTPRQPPK